MVPALSLLLLLTRDDLASAWLAAILLGLAAGAEVDLLAYLVGRCFDLRSWPDIRRTSGLPSAGWGPW